jgi:general secretion pathway protein C
MATVAETLRLDGELASQFLARLPYAVVVVLVVAIGFRFALLVADLAGPQTTDFPAPVTATAPPPNVVDMPSILRANLFGQSPVAGGSGTPVTTMPLVLTGVVPSSDEKLGLAMIGTTPTNIELKKVGDPLPGGARLHAVHVDRVLLDRSGSIEALLLPEIAGRAAMAPPTAPGAAVSIGRVEQAIRNNPSVISTVMHRTPVFSDGRLRGMRVSPGPNAEAFAKLGLRNNDLVTSINGVALNDEARSRDVFDSLVGAAQARITVERNGTMQDLQLNLAEIASEAEQIANTPVDPASLAGPPPPGPPPPDANPVPDESNPPVPPPGPDAESSR